LKQLKNNKGIALVTSLMLTLISLTIVMALLYMTTSSIKSSAQYKKYKTSLEAAYGGTEIMTKDVFPLIMQNYSSATLSATVSSNFSTLNMQVPSQKCLEAKLTQPTKNWPAECSRTPTVKSGFDLSFELSATTGNPFVVYSKIVDTTTGNSDVSGIQLEGAGVAEGNTVLTPQHFPYLYRVEVQGERENSPSAQANIEVLYAY